MTKALCFHGWHSAFMTVQLTIRGVPEEVRDHLAARAALRRQSMQEFLRCELERIASRPSPAEWLQSVRDRKESAGNACSSRQYSARPGFGSEVTLVVDASVLVAALVDSGFEDQWTESVTAEGYVLGNAAVMRRVRSFRTP